MHRPLRDALAASALRNSTEFAAQDLVGTPWAMSALCCYDRPLRNSLASPARRLRRSHSLPDVLAGFDAPAAGLVEAALKTFSAESKGCALMSMPSPYGSLAWLRMRMPLRDESAS